MGLDGTINNTSEIILGPVHPLIDNPVWDGMYMYIQHGQFTLWMSVWPTTYRICGDAFGAFSMYKIYSWYLLFVEYLQIKYAK